MIRVRLNRIRHAEHDSEVLLFNRRLPAAPAAVPAAARPGAGAAAIAECYAFPAISSLARSDHRVRVILRRWWPFTASSPARQNHVCSGGGPRNRTRLGLVLTRSVASLRVQPVRVTQSFKDQADEA